MKKPTKAELEKYQEYLTLMQENKMTPRTMDQWLEVYRATQDRRKTSEVS